MKLSDKLPSCCGHLATVSRVAGVSMTCYRQQTLLCCTPAVEPTVTSAGPAKASRAQAPNLPPAAHHKRYHGTCAAAGPAAAAACHAGAVPYSVVRWRGCRPAPRISSAMASAGSCWPWLAPAARVMLSFMSTPPMSLQPAAREAKWREGREGTSAGEAQAGLGEMV